MNLENPLFSSFSRQVIRKEIPFVFGETDGHIRGSPRQE